ncbi:MAG: TFIIB-type zinc ribbon-containing protein [Oscillospiraceae bacterium]|nr:TFIIB-type zinc ribbon-containing protein [Oscillospiraceae bacterium]
MSDITMQVSIPADNDGFVLLQCPLCSEYFKITPQDYEDDGILELRCPGCGLTSENYFTEDVIDLAMTMTKNYAMYMIHDEMKKLERKFKSKSVSFTAGKKPVPESESPIRAIIEALTKTHFPCCKRYAKIKPLSKISGYYCPFCGVKHFGIE